MNWRVPAATIRGANQAIAAFSRHPRSGLTPGQVLSSWHWLRWWIPAESHNLELVVPLAVLIVSLAALSLRGSLRHDRQQRAPAAMLGLLIPSAVTVIAWFFLAPDPRFALAPIWFVPIALAAGTMPPARFGDFSEKSLTLTAVVTTALFLSLELGNRVLLLAALVLAVAIVLIRRRYGDRAASALVRVAALSVLLATVGFLTSHGLSSFVVANQSGTFGAPPDPVPKLVRFRTHSGLVLSHPVSSTADGFGTQCWSVLFCTPYPNLNLRLRGAHLRDGFRSTP